MRKVPKLRFKEFSGEWELKKLGEVCSFEYGKPLKEIDRKGGGYPVYGSNGIVGHHNEYLVKGPFIIVGRKGTAGAVVYSEKSGFPIDTTFYVQLKDQKVDLKFLYFIMTTLDLGKVNIQAGVPGLNRNDAYKIKISIPSHPNEQQKIASFLSAIDKKIELIEKKIEFLDNYKKGLTQKLLTGEIRFPGFNGEWEEINLNEIFKNYDEKNRQHNYKQYAIGKNGIKLIDDARYNILNHKTFELNNLIIGIGINEINLNINILNGCCSPIYTIYKIDEHILNPIFGYYYIPKKAYEYKNKITKISSRRNFDIIHKDLLNLQIPFPSLPEQQKIASFLSAIDNKIELTRKKLENIKTYKKGLLQKMLI